MARKKTKRKAPQQKKKGILLPLEKEFTCPFCNHDKSVRCILDRAQKAGKVECTACGVNYTTSIHSLSEPIDVYSEWIDECEKVNDPKKRPASATLALPSLESRKHARPSLESRKHARTAERHRPLGPERAADDDDDDNEELPEVHFKHTASESRDFGYQNPLEELAAEGDDYEE